MIDNLMSYARKMISAVILSAIVLSNIPIESVNAADGDFGVYTIQIADNNTVTVTIDENGIDVKALKGRAAIVDNTVFVPLVNNKVPKTLDDFSVTSSNAENNIQLKNYEPETKTLTFDIGTNEYSLELFVYGDVDGDYVITANDAVCILNELNGGNYLSTKGIFAGDVNGDYVISIKDTIYIINCFIGAEYNFLAEISGIKDKAPTQIDFSKVSSDTIYIDADGNESEYTGDVPGDGVIIEAVPSISNPMIGEEFYVDFVLKNNPGFSGYGFTLEFDPDIVEALTSTIRDLNEPIEVKYETEDPNTGELVLSPAVRVVDIRNAISRAENGKISFANFLDHYNYSGVAKNDGVMFRIPFKAKASGSANITLRSYNGDMLVDRDAKTLPAYIKSKVVDVREKVNATGITLDKTKAEIMKGATLKLNANVTPDSANQKVIWKSSDTNVASVDSDGNVKGISNGTSIITATTVDGDYSTRCVVTVKYYDKVYYDEDTSVFKGVDSIPENELCIEAVPSKFYVNYGEEFYVDFKIKNNPGFSNYGFSINYNGYVVQPVAGKEIEMKNAAEVMYTDIDLETGETVQKPAIKVSNVRNAIQRADENGFSFGDVVVDSNYNVCVADAAGVMFRVYFKAVGEGKSNICIGPKNTLFLANSDGIKMPCYVQNSFVEVKETTIPVPDTDISINEENVEMPMGTFRVLSVETAPGGGSIAKEDIVWSSSDPSIASVYDDGTVLAHRTGTVVITAETERGKAPAQCGVTVTERTASSQYDIGDVDKDGYVTAKDAACVLRKALDSSYEYLPGK